MTRLRDARADVDLRIFWSQFANAKQHLPRRIVLSIRGESGCQRELVGSVVAIDRSCAAERPDRRLGLTARQVALPASYRQRRPEVEARGSLQPPHG